MDTNRSSVLASYTDEEWRTTTCWNEQSCDTCLRSRAGCGWCSSVSQIALCMPGVHLQEIEQSSICVPLKRVAFPLLSPISDRDVCPTYDDRWELRTSTLGCKVSTMSVLICLATIICTMLGTILLLGLGRLATRMLGPCWPTRHRGWEIIRSEQGDRIAHTWTTRKTWLDSIRGRKESISGAERQS